MKPSAGQKAEDGARLLTPRTEVSVAAQCLVSGTQPGGRLLGPSPGLKDKKSGCFSLFFSSEHNVATSW